MYIITHAAMGAVIAELMPSHPWLGFTIGFLLHFVVDIIPHGDSGIYRGYVTGTRMKRALAYVTIDAILALGFVLLIYNANLYQNRNAMTLCILGSVLPDLAVAVYEVTRTRALKGLHQVHFFFHNLVTNRWRDIGFASGFAFQIVFLAAVVSKLS